MTNFWTKTNGDIDIFSANGKVYGTFQNTSPSKPFSANIKIENKNYTISSKGFWRNCVAIIDSEDNEVLSIKLKKWYQRSYSVNFENKKYILMAGNNPLVYYSIYEENIELLSYALSSRNGKLGLKISGLLDVSVFFHFLLWYFIKPAMIENNANVEI